MSGLSQTGGLLIERLTKRFGSVAAVDGIDLEVRGGEFLTLLGPSGSGKTTLLMMIAGFQDATSGDIKLAGRSIVNVPPEKRDFGMVFQGYALFPHMTVAENIGYSLSVRGRPKDQIARRVGEMLELVQLKGMEKRLPAQLSGGQQQRVALARAICFAPPVLLLDEPLGALDKKLRVDVQAQLKELHRTLGTTFIYVTHDQDEALSMSDRVVIMRNGMIEQIGTPEELYARPRTSFAATFLGRSNILQRSNELYSLRPERINIHEDRTETGSVSGKVISATYFGALVKYLVETTEYGVLEVDADFFRQASFKPSAMVDLTWPEEAMVRLEKSEKETSKISPANKI